MQRLALPPYIALLLIAAVSTPVIGSDLAPVIRGAHEQLLTEYAQEYDYFHKYPRMLYEPGKPLPRPVVNPHNLVWTADRGPVDVLLRRTGAALDDLAPRLSPARCRGFTDRLRALRNRADQASQTDKGLFLEICALRREIMLANPLLDFDRIIYSTGGGAFGLYHTAALQGFDRQVRRPSHRKNRTNFWTDEHWKGGYDFSRPEREAPPSDQVSNVGLFALQGWRDGEPESKPLLAEATITSGPHAGKKLSHFPGQYHFAFDLSYDGRQVLFARSLGPEAPSHIWRGDLETGEVRQLTNSWFADVEPCLLPNGRVVFISYRRWCAVRCQSSFPQACASLWSMAGDGEDEYPISWHETSEMFPVVDTDGRIIYSRWDYIDRGTVIAHNLWRCMPDGRDPRAPHGNYGPENAPWDTPAMRRRLVRAHGPAVLDLLAAEKRMRRSTSTVPGRPVAEYHIRPIPGRLGHYVAIAGIHHGSGWGAVVLIDTNKPDDGGMSQVSVVRGEGIPAEFRGGSGWGFRPAEARYSTPWPLSESYFLATRTSPRRRAPTGLCLMDVFGNVELLSDAPAMAPRPLRCRPKPPALPTRTWQGERAGRDDHYRAVISVVNAYESDQPWPEGTRLTALRIIQIVPIPWGGYRNTKDDSDQFKMAGHSYPHSRSCLRMVLGTVPLEADGSAYFEAPVGKEIYFQALDENGMAVQSMRSGTYVHPGEHLSCHGCHKTTGQAPARPDKLPLALKRTPSEIKPGPVGSAPLNYHRLVRPVLEKTCIPCHVKEKCRGPKSAEYKDLGRLAFHFGGVGSSTGTETVPGEFGARRSRMGKALLASHRDRITPEQFRRIIVWLDANSMELGALHHQDEQRAGQVVWPLLEVDPDNPQGIERDRPLRPGPRGATTP
jgi:hypothetical protein